MTRRISVPVLLGIGTEDAFFCGAGADCSSDAALVASQVAHFAAAARLRATVLPGAGHDPSLARNASQFYAATATWLRSTAALS